MQSDRNENSAMRGGDYLLRTTAASSAATLSMDVLGPAPSDLHLRLAQGWTQPATGAGQALGKLGANAGGSEAAMYYIAL
jgi:hypothetical protein